MDHLFSAAGLEAMQNFVGSQTLFAFDIDGTLAPIADDPARILIPEQTRSRLVDLNQTACVAVITGRSRADARKFLGFDPHLLIGNHGAEGLPGWERHEKKFRHVCKAWQDQLRQFIPDVADGGVVIENKGTTISLHYRNSSNHPAAIDTLNRAIGQLVPKPRRISGIYVENIMPCEAPLKGEALLQIMKHTGCSKAIYVGDDITDEDVFRLKIDNILGIRVGCESSSVASYCILNQEEIIRLLDAIILLNRATHARETY